MLKKMNKVKTVIFILYSVILAAAAFFLAGYLRADPQGVVITDKTPVEFNIIERDVRSMSLDDLQNDAQCLYTGFPGLDIVSVGNRDYMLSASLCERRWQKVVTIKARDSPRNIIMGGPFIDNSLRSGAWAQYYKLYGRVGFGGGVLLCRDYAVVQGGVAWMW
jgi:hypothetical protein